MLNPSITPPPLGLAMLDRQLFDRQAPDAQLSHSQASDRAALDRQPADRQRPDRAAAQRERSDGERPQRAGAERLRARGSCAGGRPPPTLCTTSTPPDDHDDLPPSRVGPANGAQRRDLRHRSASGAPRPRARRPARSSAPMRLARALDRLGDRVGQVDPVGVGTLRRGDRRRAPDGRGCRRRSSSGGTSVITTLLAPIFAPWPIVIGPEQLRARADRDVVLHRRMALARGEARAAERHALIQRHVVADVGGLADHDARRRDR